MDFQAKTDVQQAEIQAVVIRADGTREDLGVIAYYHRNPLKRAMWALKRKIKETNTHGNASRQ